MEKGVNLCDFGDILLHAESIGYGWNEAHDILEDYYPMYGTTHVYRDDVEDDTNPAAREILLSYFDSEGIKDFYIKPKEG